MTVTNFIYNFDTPTTWVNQGSYFQRQVVYYEGAISPSTPPTILRVMGGLPLYFKCAAIRIEPQNFM